MNNYSGYIEIGIVVILTLIVLSFITYIKKKRREERQNDDYHFYDKNTIDDKEYKKITGFKARQRKKTKSYDLVIYYFQHYQILIDEIQEIKSSDLLSIEKIARVRHHLHLYQSKLKNIESKLDSEVKDEEFLQLKNELYDITAPFYKRVLRRLLEFETIQRSLDSLIKKSDENQAQIIKLKEEQRNKYKEYSQQKLDYLENRKEVYKKLVYKISSSYRIE